MFHEVELSSTVIIPAEKLDTDGLVLKRVIITELLKQLEREKCTKLRGYFLSLTTLNSIGEGKVTQQNLGAVLFPVAFSAITFNIYRGEVIDGVVEKVMKHGVTLKCGPLECVYLSSSKMPGYSYVTGENPVFVCENQPKIEKDVAVRVIVVGTKWLEDEREFMALVSLEGDYLGPV